MSGLKLQSVVSEDCVDSWVELMSIDWSEIVLNEDVMEELMSRHDNSKDRLEFISTKLTCH